jgi:hypothetical protein
VELGSEDAVAQKLHGPWLAPRGVLITLVSVEYCGMKLSFARGSHRHPNMVNNTTWKDDYAT